MEQRLTHEQRGIRRSVLWRDDDDVELLLIEILRDIVPTPSRPYDDLYRSRQCVLQHNSPCMRGGMVESKLTIVSLATVCTLISVGLIDRSIELVSPTVEGRRKSATNKE